MKFLFRSSVTPKPYNEKYYWVDHNIIPHIIIEASHLNEALMKYINFAGEHGIDIYDFAVKNASPMYIDLSNGESKQTGYVFTGHLDIYSNYSTKKYACDVWTQINRIEDINFEEE